MEPAIYGAVNYDPWGKPRIGDWIQTWSRRKFHLLDPRPEDFCIEDISHALANQCRFTGHTRRFYSVGEHSVRVARYVATNIFLPKSYVYTALMHDATEAYMCDLARPFKQLPEFAFYRELEDKLMAQIAIAFEVIYPFPKIIKTADEILLGTEARDLMAPTPDGWHFRYEHLPERIRPWSHGKAKREFLKLFNEVAPEHLRQTRRTFGGFFGFGRKAA